ncbi:MAG: hypothetical protein HY923_11605 [Elusimicrobia bacterium]|nr:hypothetical protein [Elusimicrobiota bacterium]
MKKPADQFRSGFAQTLIRRLFKSTPDFFSGRGLLVTCLDSNCAPAESAPLIRELSDWGVAPEIIGKYFWVPPELVNKFVGECRALTGFDEIYLMRTKPTSDLVLRSVPSVASCMFTGDPPVEVVENMKEIGATRYASDGIGIGLNYVCEIESLQRQIDLLGNELPR